MLIAIFVISFLIAYTLFCLVFLRILKRIGVKIDYKELFFFFLYFDGPTLTSDFGKNAKSKLGKYLLNFVGDLGVNAIYYLLLLVSMGVGFASVYLFS